eukprot:TRINITY_DN14923_c0_g1_i1.p1 TRINITY_DN14923_c0_g1~~TRINITY_DN14923_c0_g1_i1.p1  ORF type:complete len:363 (+),score=42.93 TRINITY_DN14923_c0_g1_i1:18-1106(+)
MSVLSERVKKLEAVVGKEGWDSWTFRFEELLAEAELMNRFEKYPVEGFFALLPTEITEIVLTHVNDAIALCSLSVVNRYWRALLNLDPAETNPRRVAFLSRLWQNSALGAFPLVLRKFAAQTDWGCNYRALAMCMARYQQWRPGHEFKKLLCIQLNPDTDLVPLKTDMSAISPSARIWNDLLSNSRDVACIFEKINDKVTMYLGTGNIGKSSGAAAWTRSGYGVYVSFDPENTLIFAGEHSGAHWSGRGKLMKKDAAIFSQFSNSVANGQGQVLDLANRLRFSGTFYNGLFHGNGSYFGENFIYKGNFHNGYFHGTAVVTDCSHKKNVQLSGNYSSGSLSGQNCFEFQPQDYWIGLAAKQQD